MTDTTVEVTATPAPAKPADNGPEPFDAGRAQEKITAANNEARNLRARLKEMEPKAAEFDKLSEAQKTAEQKLRDANATTERERDDARTEALRVRMALRHGLAEEDLDLLGSGTELELEDRAKRIAVKNAAAAAAAARPDPVTGRRPVAQLHPGASPADTPAETDWLTPEKR